MTGPLPYIISIFILTNMKGRISHLVVPFLIVEFLLAACAAPADYPTADNLFAYAVRTEGDDLEPAWADFGTSLADVRSRLSWGKTAKQRTEGEETWLYREYTIESGKVKVTESVGFYQGQFRIVLIELQIPEALMDSFCEKVFRGAEAVMPSTLLYIENAPLTNYRWGDRKGDSAAFVEDRYGAPEGQRVVTFSVQRHG